MNQMMLEANAEAIKEAAKSVTNKAAKLGNKVFISAVRNELGNRMNKESFEELLVTLSKKGLVTLARADMAYALDQEYVKGSEFKNQNSTFHFIQI